MSYKQKVLDYISLVDIALKKTELSSGIQLNIIEQEKKKLLDAISNNEQDWWIKNKYDSFCAKLPHEIKNVIKEIVIKQEEQKKQELIEQSKRTDNYCLDVYDTEKKKSNDNFMTSSKEYKPQDYSLVAPKTFKFYDEKYKEIIKCHPLRFHGYAGHRLFLKDEGVHCVHFCEKFYTYPVDQDGIRLIPTNAICPHSLTQCRGHLAYRLTRFGAIWNELTASDGEILHPVEAAQSKGYFLSHLDDVDGSDKSFAEKLSKKYRWRIPTPFAVAGENTLYVPFAGTGVFYEDSRDGLYFDNTVDHCIYHCPKFKKYLKNKKGYTIIPQNTQCVFYKGAPCRGHLVFRTDADNPKGWFQYENDVILKKEQIETVESLYAEAPKDCPKALGKQKNCIRDEAKSLIEKTKTPKPDCFDDVFKSICGACVLNKTKYSR